MERIRKTIEWLFQPLIKLSRKIILPGFDGMPLYDVSVFFYKGVMKNSLNLRASAISFDFIMALAPAVLFLFTLIPLLPIPDLHNSVIETLHSALPENAFLTIQSTIEEIVSRSHGGFLSLGFLLSAYFASNGMISIMRAFNQSVLVSETRSNLKIRLLALFLVVIVSLIVIIAAGLQVMSYRFIDFLSGNPFIPPFWLKVMIFLAKYLVLTFILFTIYSFIYYFAPARPGMYRFISAGSTLATIISIIALELFSYFINNFGHYNRVYGSLGTLIVILLLININALILLVGFELNASIFKAKKYDSRE